MTTKDLIEKDLGVQVFYEENPRATAITTTAARILDNNPGGLQLTIINLGTNDVYIWTAATVSTTLAIRLAASGGSYEIDYRRFGLATTQEWWCLTAAGTSTVAVRRLSIL